MDAVTFPYQSVLSLNDLPPLQKDTFIQAMEDSLAENLRLLAFFAIPEEGDQGSSRGRSLLALFSDDRTADSGQIRALRSEPLTSFPSLTPRYPEAHLFEREIHEETGIVPEHHPWPKSVRRTPDSPEFLAEGFPFFRTKGREVHEVAVGPVHAGVIEPGHFRFQCFGETVLHLEIALGYQHRGLERLIAKKRLSECLPWMECVAGDTTIGHGLAYCTILERLRGHTVRALDARMRNIALELERIANHTGDLGAIAGDTGFLPTSSWNGRIRGDVLNTTALLCGNRFGRGLLHPFGVRSPVPDPDAVAAIVRRVFDIERDVEGSLSVMLGSSSVHERCHGIGIVHTDIARRIGMCGIAARASDLNADARIHAPLAAETACARPWISSFAATGDVLARVHARIADLRSSFGMLKEDLESLVDASDVFSDGQGRGSGTRLSDTHTEPFPPDTLAVAQVEGWRGEIVHVCVTGKKGGDAPARSYRIYDPSFRNWMGLAIALRGNQISDFPLCNKSFNLSYCGFDL